MSENRSSDPRWVTKSQLKKLSSNFFSRLQVLDGATHRPVNCDDPSDPKKNDTRSVYFDKKDLDDLFNANPGSNGLKIYFGIHDPNIFNPGGTLNPRYNNKMMVVLVSTIDGKENLVDDLQDGVVILGDGSGQGLDTGKLCPPNSGC